MSDHLGNKDELIEFVKEMRNQWIKHKDEKSNLRDEPFNEVLSLTNTELEKRRKQIFELLVTIKFSKTKSVKQKKELAKQLVHMANYCMIAYTKTIQDLEK